MTITTTIDSDYASNDPRAVIANRPMTAFQFGVIAPQPFSEATGSDPWTLQTECVVEATAEVHLLLDVRIRFLQVQARSIEGQR